MESLALLVSLIVLGRVLFAALCTTLVIYLVKYNFVDGMLHFRGIPNSPWYWAGIAIVAIVSLVIFVSSLLK